MKWMIGVDLRHGSEGALAWAGWLREHDATADLLAMHAVEIPKGRIPVMPDLDLVTRYVQRFVADRLPGVEVRLFQEQPPEAALAHGVTLHHADVLVIGRRSGRDEDALIRLGAVARRVLRHLVVPVVVCPPDLTVDDIPDGPVVVAVRPDVHSAAALAFGRRLAESLGRGLTAVSVLPRSFPAGVSYLPAPAYQGDDVAAAEQDLRAWIDAQPGDAPDLEIGQGPTIPTLLRGIDSTRACAVVCGSRMLSTLERITHTSVGTTIAAMAPIPVVVVPPA